MMTEKTTNGASSSWSRWRIGAWGVAALVLLLPLVAMQFTNEVNWTLGDFVFAALLILGVGVPFELAVRKSGNTVYRIAIGVALVTAFLLVWTNLAVGLIGNEGEPANLMYFGVLAVGLVGAFMVRFQARGMAFTLLATGVAQMLVAGIVLLAGMHEVAGSSVGEVLKVTGFFAALWLTSGGLFWHTAQGASTASTEESLAMQ